MDKDNNNLDPKEENKNSLINQEQPKGKAEPPQVKVEPEVKAHDVMASLREAMESQAGLPKLELPETTPKEDKGPKEGSGSGDNAKKETDFGDDLDDDLGQEEPNPKEGEKEEVEEPKSKNPKRLLEATSNALVRKGDAAQSTATMFLFDWRCESELRKAKRDLTHLMNKVERGEVLDELERQVMKYARGFISDQEAQRKALESGSHLSKEDLDVLEELLTSYFIEKGGDPPVWVTALFIVGGTLLANMYSAFTSRPMYNPPV